jgi:sugar phosphate permease
MQALRAERSSTRLHYAWVVAGVTFLALLASAGIRATYAVLVLPLEHDFNSDRAAISLALSINLLLYGLCGPFAGALMARFGVRRVMLAALVTLASAVGLSTLMQSVWQLILLWGVLVGLGSGAMALVLGATVATRWFVKRRGLVTGVFAASSATGQLIFLPGQAALVEAAGWRTAVLLVAGVAVSVAVLVALFMRDEPTEVGAAAYGALPETLPTVATRGNPLAMAVRTLIECARVRDFWLLAGSFAICGATTVGLISVHLIPASVEHGMPEVTAAGMLAAMGVFDLVGTTGSGWLSASHRPAQTAGLVLHVQGHSPAVSAVRVQRRCASAGRFRRFLRARLGGDRATDGSPRGRSLWQRTGWPGFRLGVRGAPVRRVDCRLCCGGTAHLAG